MPKYRIKALRELREVFEGEVTIEANSEEDAMDEFFMNPEESGVEWSMPFGDVELEILEIEEIAE